MDKKDFGQLVAILRKELRNEFDEPMSQYDLAGLARIPLVTLQKIEQGRQANIKPHVLLNLAEALQLSSSATQTFFLASLGIKDSQAVRPVATPQNVLAELIQILSKLQSPAYIMDSFGDFVVVNPCSLAVFDLEVGQLPAPHLLSQYNILRLYFSPEFENLHEMMGATKSEFLHRVILLFKLRSLKVRNHWYFQKLLPELNHWQGFRALWQSPYLYEEDIYGSYNPLNLNHPGLGLLRFVSYPTQAITTQGDLSLFTLQPLDAHTAEACVQLSRKLGTQPIHLAPWPKPPAPTSTPNGL